MRADRVRLRAGDVGRRLLFADDPDPRVLQGVIAVIVSLDYLLRTVDGSPIALRSWPTLALALALVLTAATFVVPWSRLPRVAVAVIPLLDILALGLARLDSRGSAAAAAIVVPALWLGRQFGKRGAVATCVAGLLFLAVPSVLYLGVGGVNLSRSLIVPVVASWIALALAAGIEKIEAAYAENADRRTELALALHTIDEQRRFAEAILDTVDVGLVLLDHTGAYRTVNKRHTDFMRQAYPDGHGGMAGQLGHVFAPDGTTVLTRDDMPTYRAANGEEFDDCRIWVGADPISRRALSVSARSVRGGDGSFAGAALAYKDVTEFMRVLQVKDEFIASVSHELRTPLTSIMGYVDLLLERPDLPADQAAQLQVVARNSDRLRRLVADLLHTAQIDDGPMHVVRTTSDLSAIVHQSLLTAAPVARAGGITLEWDVPDALPVLVDAQRMSQVVDNLLSNAIKYTPDGGVVRVALGVDGGRVELSVTDTGIGISAHDLSRLFTRFFRARTAEERSIQGIGLGLSITKSIVETHGGRIEVESKPDQGSTFRVRLPLEVRQQAVARPVAS
jgi:two-component system phosphate regulon sensor histidine kinase PhoR